MTTKNDDNALANVFAGILAQAAKTPTHTGATAKAHQRLSGAGTAFVLMLDVSSSMDERVNGKRKMDILGAALTGSLPAGPGAPRLLAFSTAVVEIPSLAALPAPNGSTALHLALEAAAVLKPGVTLVVSDGHPNDAAAALAAADRLPGRIDVLYVGPEDDAGAIAFMRKLARTGGGRVVVHDLRKYALPQQLSQAVRGLLPAPGGH